MNSELATLLGLTEELLFHGFAVFLRVGAVIALLPGFGERTVPTRIKLALAFALSVIVGPAVQTLEMPVSFDLTFRLIMTETIAGALFGIGIRLLVLALQTAGSIAAQSTSLSQILGGAVTDPLPAMGYILIVGGLALAMLADLHIKAAELIIFSYELLPMAQYPSGALISSWGMLQISKAFALAFTLAAPFMVVSVIYNLALGAINKAMPQLMVAFVGAPVITAGGLFILALAAPFMLQQWLVALNLFLANPAGGN